MISEYLKLQSDYQQKYGKNTVVLYQVGCCYQIYEYDPNKDKNPPVWPTEKLGLAGVMSKLLGYTFTSINSNKPYSITNPNMVGFPTIAYDKHISNLLAKEYTVVVVDQKKDGNTITRQVSKVLSPATEINDLSSIPVSNQILSIYIEVQKETLKIENYLLTTGVSTIDVTTGNNTVAEIYSKPNDAIYALQEIYRFLLSVQPREILVNITGISKENKSKYEKYIINLFELEKYPMYIILSNQVNKEYSNPNYHQQFLTKIFNTIKNKNKNKNLVIQTNNIIVEILGLERFHYGTICFIILLQYCYEHNENLVEKIQAPDTMWIDEDTHLVPTHNACLLYTSPSPRD